MKEELLAVSLKPMSQKEKKILIKKKQPGVPAMARWNKSDQ